MVDPVSRARALYERDPPVQIETSFLAARSAFHDSASAEQLEVWRTQGDFGGRLRALFGEPIEPMGLMLRHRERGAILTAYIGREGPSYGAALGHSDTSLARELDGLVSAVDPVPWEGLSFDRYRKQLMRIGWDGAPFERALHGAEAIQQLCDVRDRDMVLPDLFDINHAIVVEWLRGTEPHTLPIAVDAWFRHVRELRELMSPSELNWYREELLADAVKLGIDAAEASSSFDAP